MEYGLQLGAGGIIALLLLREVFKFLSDRQKKSNGTTVSGDKTVEFWQQEIRLAVKDSVAILLVPGINTQNELLRDIRFSMDKTKDGVNELVTLSRQHNKG